MSAAPVKISPLAPKEVVHTPPIEGISLATAAAGIRYPGRRDILLIAMDEGTAAAGVFTKSKCPSAAVDWCKANIGQSAARALIVNTGNANAFTGSKGVEATELTAKSASIALSCRPEDVMICSTGVIGEPLDAGKIEAVMPELVARLQKGNWLDAANAIMTTDTFPKLAVETIKTSQREILIVGMAKGAGMIAPDMATMLAFIFTDAKIEPQYLQAITASAAEKTFNCVTVDGDTSTSDTLLVFATGKSIDLEAQEKLFFEEALTQVMRNLAMLIAKDGEGARKFITVDVKGAQNNESAKIIAKSIANSPLVKTAIAGEDANWGRVVMAVGKAGEPADRDRLAISFGSYCVARCGMRVEDYSEKDVSAYMRSDEIQIVVDLNLGPGAATVWTCDLTKDYVAINGDYRS